MFATQLFPWSILASMIAYITIGVGHATFHRVDRKYLSAVLLGLMLPVGAVVTGVVGSALPALRLSAANPEVQAALNRSIYWNSLQGLGNGFLLLVLVVAALITEMIDRNFNRAAFWCVLAAAFSWVGLMHSPIIKWGAQPMYAIGWLAAAVIVFSAHCVERRFGAAGAGEFGSGDPQKRSPFRIADSSLASGGFWVRFAWERFVSKNAGGQVPHAKGPFQLVEREIPEPPAGSGANQGAGLWHLPQR